MAMATSSDSKINLSMVNGHFIAKWQMATSLSIMAKWPLLTKNGKWPSITCLDGHIIICYVSWPNLFMADAHTVAQSLYVMVIATVIWVKNG